MLRGIVVGLIVAYILSLFGVNVIILEAVQPFIKTVILTNSQYYVFFGLVGLISGMFTKEELF